MCTLGIFVWGKGTGVNGCTECLVGNICMGKGNWVDGCTECVGCEYLYGERELCLTVVLNVYVGNICMGKWNLC
jgi:hypothetical protein